MGRRTAVLLCSAVIAVGTATAVAVPLAFSGSDAAGGVQTLNAGAATRLAATGATTLAGPDGAPTSVPAPSSVPAPAQYSVAPAPPTVTATSPADVPVAVTVGGTAISAPVTAVGVDRTGDVEIPEQVTTVGWYRFSARPGAPAGSTVLVGHVDSAEQGEGAFFRLHTAAAGATVTVRTASGATATYRVVSVQAYPKTAVPLSALFSLDGSPRLTLVTCGGSFDAASRSYRDNVVVTAVPA